MAYSPIGAHLTTAPLFHIPIYHTLEAVPTSIRSDALATYDADNKELTEGLSPLRLRKDNGVW